MMGTVARLSWKGSLPAWRATPSASESGPGRTPGVSSNSRSGSPKASQSEAKRAAFSEASVSMVPASAVGAFAMTPTGLPSTRARAVTTFRA